MRFQILAAAVIALSVAHAAGPRAEPIYDPAALAPFEARPANAVVSGQAFLRQKGGGVVTCAGAAVSILPDIPYTRAVLEWSKVSGQMPRNGDKRLAKASRMTQCDAEGNFEFPAIGAGDYIISTVVMWSVGYRQQGGALVKFVTVQPKARLKILLTDGDLFSSF